MKLTMLAKDNDSGRSGCPSVYLAADGSAVVQADMVDADTHANLENLLPGEGGVRIKMDVLVAAVAAYQKRR